ncbi:hypothetical protein [Desemzia sp. FAM 23990]|uniref:hypothetical protein n=1 Tax=Desemzia sp. FAM 23990 TaxID=3259520 RepID=UPI0038856651
MKVENDYSEQDRILEVFKDLNKYSLEIGIFGSDDSFMAMIANVHEFGMTIKPKGKWLTIPTKEAGNRTAKDIPDLFKPKGVNALVVEDKRKRGRNKDGFIVMFWLAKEVNIPERSFIRSTFDEKEDDWFEFFQNRLDDIVLSKITAKNVWEQLGALITKDVQNKIREIKTPGKSELTLQRNPSKNNPLISTGRMLQSVTWKVVKR